MVDSSPKDDALPANASEMNSQALPEQDASENPSVDEFPSTAARSVEDVESESAPRTEPEQPTLHDGDETSNSKSASGDEEQSGLDSTMGADSQHEGSESAQQSPDDAEPKVKPVSAFFAAHRKQLVIAVAVIVVIAAGAIVGVPAYHLWQGNQALESGAYLQAAQEFEAAELLGGRDRIQDVAQACMKSGDYSTAATIFSMDGSSSSKRYATFCEGMAALEKGEYSTAVSKLEGSEVDGAAEAYAQASYNYGKELVESEQFEDALEQFDNAGTYQDAEEWVERCENTIAFDEAEELYQSGNLPAAQEAFADLPRSFERNGVTVAQRRQALKDHQAFVNMCGDYTSTTGECEVRQTHKSTGRWYNWTADISGYTAHVSCVINDDGSVTVSGSASFYRYTNFSTISAGVDGTQDTVNFSFNTSSLPNGRDIGDNAELTYSDGKLSLHYYRVDRNEDLYFDYLYRTDISYRKN